MAKSDTNMDLMNDLRERYGRPPTVFHPSGVLVFDDLWGGGMPSGKMIEIHSQAGLGKSTTFLQMCRYQCEQGRPVAYVDVEHALDQPLKDSIGISRFEDETWGDGYPMFFHIDPSTFDEVDETLELLITKIGYQIVVFDSLTMTIADKQADKKISEEQPAQHALMSNRILKRVKPMLARTGCTMLLVNQMRVDLSGWKAILKPAGGEALKFATDIRTSMRRIRMLEREDSNGDKDIYGVELEVSTIKNKTAKPYRTAIVQLEFGKGINNISSMALILFNRGIITKHGSWYEIPGVEGKVQGVNGVIQWVRENLGQAKNLLNGDMTDTLVIDGKTAEEALS